MPLRSERRFISLSNVESGMMVQFRYKKKSGGSGDYTVLVVDPDRTNDHASEPQLHGYLIDKFSDDELIRFFSSFRKSLNIDYENRRGNVLEGLNTDEAYKQFATSGYVSDRSYRTFNLSGISQLRQILIGSVD
jgi:hypothetical protein